MSDERTEQVLHEAFWTDGQRAVSNAETAIREARGVIYMLMRALVEPSAADGARYLASGWLDDHGRDGHLEAKLPPGALEEKT